MKEPISRVMYFPFGFDKILSPFSFSTVIVVTTTESVSFLSVVMPSRVSFEIYSFLSRARSVLKIIYFLSKTIELFRRM